MNVIDQISANLSKIQENQIFTNKQIQKVEEGLKQSRVIIEKDMSLLADLDARLNIVDGFHKSIHIKDVMNTYGEAQHLQGKIAGMLLVIKMVTEGKP